MDESILRKVSDSLKAKSYATNDTWLRECVEYFLTEHSNLSHDEVLKFVITQWQLSDLREISNERPCLPPNLAREKYTTLHGNFILQMEKVYDISESKYKQLEQIRNISNNNIEVTENEKTQAWEPKKKRMLYFHLTDGVQDVKAVEDEPIRLRQASLLPGYKLLIKGPSICRRGVILLNATNVVEIGGEVESLLILNALENVLARALNLEENPDPYSDIGETRAPENQLFDDDFDIDMEDVALIEAQSQEKPASSNNRAAAASPVQIPDEPPSRRVEASRNYNEPPLNERSESDLIFDMIDDNIFENVTESASTAASNSRTKSKAPKQFLPQDSVFFDDDDDFPELFNSEPTTTSAKSRKESSTLENTGRMIDREIDRPLSFETSPIRRPSGEKFRSNNDDPENSETLSIKELSISQPRILSSNERISENSAHSTHQDFPMKNLQDSHKRSSFEKTPISKSSTDQSRFNINNPKISAASPIKQSNKLRDKLSDKPEVKESLTVGIKRPAAVLSSPMPNQPAGKQRCTQMTPKLSKMNRKITDFMKRGEPTDNATSKVKTYDQISDILNASSTNTAVQHKTVKGKITKMEKLSRNGQFWELNATIMDHSGSIDVEFCSKILEKLLGFSVPEFSLKKKQKKSNPEIEKQLREGFRRAETKLVQLKAPLEIELAPDKKPKIIKIIETIDE